MRARLASRSIRTARRTAFAAATAATLLALPRPAAATDHPGAVLLRGDDDVKVKGIQVLDPAHEAYHYWQGDTLFAGARDPNTGNQVELLAEFFWFATSLDRNADYYSVVLKVKTSPRPDTAWQLETDSGEHWYNPDRTFNPTQELIVDMDPSGSGGAIRWDWCVPFTDYKYEPLRTIEVQQGYSLGLDTEGTLVSEKKADGTMARILAKGSFDARRKVQSNYSITLYAWEMYVSGGGERMGWRLGLTAEDRSKQSAYHEYFLIVQSRRDVPAVLSSVEFAGHMREDRWIGSDNVMTIDALLEEITINPPSLEDRCNLARREGSNLLGCPAEGGAIAGADVTGSVPPPADTTPVVPATPGCRGDRDCGHGEACLQGICRPDPDAKSDSAECLRNSDCPEGRICSPQGTCINECVVDRDCADNGLCVAGSCDHTGGAIVDVRTPTLAIQCELTSDCPEAQVCNPMGRCIQECRADRDCLSEQTCAVGRCVAGLNAEHVAPVGAASGGCSTAPGAEGLGLGWLASVAGLLLAGVGRRRRTHR
jgi:hypothetical protein